MSTKARWVDEENKDFVGIGCCLEKLASGDHRIDLVQKGGPSAAAGLSPGYVIKAVDFRATKGLEASQIHNLLLGRPGSKVILTVQRTDAVIEDVEICRFSIPPMKATTNEGPNQLHGDDGIPSKESFNNPISSFFGKIFEVFSIPAESTQNARHNVIARQSSPALASSVKPEVSPAARPNTFSASSELSHEDDVQKGIDRLRAQTSNAALALDSVVEDILKRRMQRLAALEQVGQQAASLSKKANLDREATDGLDRSTLDENVGKALVSAIVTRGAQPKVDHKTELRPEFLSVHAHPLLYRSVEPNSLSHSNSGDFEDESMDDARALLVEKLRSMEDMIKRLEKPSPEIPQNAAPQAREFESPVRERREGRERALPPQEHVASPKPETPAAKIQNKETPAILVHPTTALPRVPEFLLMEVIRGKDLPAMDVLTGSSDPYCKVQLESMTFQTNPVMHNINPVWNEKFKIPMSGIEVSKAELRITIFDWNRVLKHSPMGTASIPLKKVLMKGAHEAEWFDLLKAENIKAQGGSILIKFSSDPSENLEGAGHLGARQEQRSQLQDKSLLVNTSEKQHTPTPLGAGIRVL